MNAAPVCAWRETHAPTAQQRADFAAYRIVLVRDRHKSWQALLLDTLLACAGAPDVLLLTWRNDQRGFCIRYIHAHQPGIVVIKALTDASNARPSGLYVSQRYEAGRGLVSREWYPRKEFA